MRGSGWVSPHEVLSRGEILEPELFHPAGLAGRFLNLKRQVRPEMQTVDRHAPLSFSIHEFCRAIITHQPPASNGWNASDIRSLTISLHITESELSRVFGGNFLGVCRGLKNGRNGSCRSW